MRQFGEGGAILKIDKIATEFFYTKWEDEDFGPKRVSTGNSKFQTFWEFWTLLLAAIAWSTHLSGKGVLFAGDNTASLQLALDLKGQREMNLISRELAWRKAREGWKFALAHLPEEQNKTADALSRQFAPKPLPFPSSALKNAKRILSSPPALVWRIAEDNLADHPPVRSKRKRTAHEQHL